VAEREFYYQRSIDIRRIRWLNMAKQNRRYRMKRYLWVPTMLVLMAMLASVAAAAPLAAIGVPNPGSATTNIVIQNTDAADDNEWVLDFIAPDGNPVAAAQQTGTLPPYVATSVATGGLTVLGTGWNGSAIVMTAGSQPAAVSFTAWAGGTQGDGTTAAEYAGFPKGYDKLTFPYSFNSNRVSWITVQNTGDNPETVYFQFIDRRTGLQTGSTTNATIPGQAQRTYRLNDCSTGVVPTGVCTRPNTDDEGQYWKGATIVTADPGKEVLAGVATTHWARWTGQYVGVPETETANELIFPLFFRVRTEGGVFSESKPYQRYSDMNIVNPDLNNATQVTIKLYHVSGALSDQWTVSIPKGSSIAVNTRFGGTGAPPDWATRWPTKLVDSASKPNWLGTAIVTAETGKEVSGICFNFWPSSNADYVAGYNAVTRDLGKERLFLPASHHAGSGVTFFSQAQLQNLETTPITVDIYFYEYNRATGGTGSSRHHLSGIVIPGNSSLSMNTKFNSTGFPSNWFTSLGSSFHGSIAVISRGGDIAGVDFNLNNTSGSQRASAYNGVLLDK
jgi:hypothetical protein